jgi:1,4-alpha-glucan branching enzyme
MAIHNKKPPSRLTDNKKTRENPGIPAAAQRIIDARHHDPFDFLGRHQLDNGITVIRAFIPQAHDVRIVDTDFTLQRQYNSDLFEWQGSDTEAGQIAQHYRIQWTDSHGHTHQRHDPYTFLPQLSDFDLYLFNEGRHHQCANFLGAHPICVDGVHGVLFAIWAADAERISVVGNFNQWDGRSHPMRVRGASGVWELFIPGINTGELYKFEIRNRHNGSLHLKTDPYARASEMRPQTASVITADSDYHWQDQTWLQQRSRALWLHQPMSIYEVHLGSWRRQADGGFLNYRELAHGLVDYCKDLNFTHIELLPITEHPLDDSWGYQTTGYFAPTSRFGKPDDFRYFVDYCHQHDIGVILDWVPGHFPKDSHGLALFDGSPLYEHADPRLGEHRDWGTLIFNYGRAEVSNFLLSSALYWLDEYHLDGLRVDAVASMLYLDYSREADDWIPNIHGGNENLDAIDFLRNLNSLTHEHHPGTVILAEESTSWPMVSRPVWQGGLGFSMKWNMGWMHDTLEYMMTDPLYRSHHHDRLTFSQLYAFTENFMLPFSHDEVVHGKHSLLYRMPGDEWQRFANLRLLYTYMFAHPGKKLLFMGCEFGQGDEWNHNQALDWYVLEHPYHQGIQTLIRDLNKVYKENSALYQYDFEPQGFDWIDCHDSSQSVLSFIRRSDTETLIVILNFTPQVHHGYTIGVPHEGSYEEILNSDSRYFGGSDTGNHAPLRTRQQSWMGREWSIDVNLPPLAGIILRYNK